MPVIKNNSSSGSVVGGVAALNIASFSEQARKMVIEAQTKASRVVAQATAKSKEMAVQAADRGYAEGYQRGLAEGQADGAEKAFNEAKANFDKQTADLQDMLKQAIRQIERARNDLLQQARTELLDLALVIAEKVTHVQAAGDIEVAKASLAKAIDMVSCSGQVLARVCPAQLDQLAEYGGEFLAEMGMNELVKFVGDAELTCGDVVLVSRNGKVDASIQTQIDNVIAAVVGKPRNAE